MCLSVTSSSPALISFTGFWANLDPFSFNFQSPAPDIADVLTHSAISPSTLAFASLDSEGSGVRPEEGRTVNLLERSKAGLSQTNRYCEYPSTILKSRARSIVQSAVIAGASTRTDQPVSL
ncbi:hypothetical protein N7475_000112 [Penicillium sp. IBT 31633x]|nr:hypothetical protein N7475_000112 [Penicillium sp. IBT 31633x]